MYPVAQVQEPYSAVGYLAARVPLVDLLHLDHPDPDQLDDTKKRLGKSDQTSIGVAEKDNGAASANGSWKMKEGESDTGRSYAKDGQLWTPWDVCDGEFDFSSCLI